MDDLRSHAWQIRARQWQLRTQTLVFGKLPLLMGIVNVTPDSFSDGGKFHGTSSAIDQALRLIDEGASIVDVGGESTRPYATPVTAQEELARVLPVIEGVRKHVRTPISIDTFKPLVAREALAAGCEIINDVTGLANAEMCALAVETGAGVCAMHMQGTPQTMQDDPQYHDVVSEIEHYLALRRDALLSAGLLPQRICLDPGIGFGKTHQHNLTLLANCWQYHALGCPLLVGHSRKGFIGKVLGNKEAPRVQGTVGAALSLAAQGIQVLRVHDVRDVREALLLFAAAGGIDGQPGQLE